MQSSDNTFTKKLRNFNQSVMKEQNIYEPYRPNIERMANWWRTPKKISCAKDKGGSFNMQLYLDYLTTITENENNTSGRVR